MENVRAYMFAEPDTNAMELVNAHICSKGKCGQEVRVFVYLASGNRSAAAPPTLSKSSFVHTTFVHYNTERIQGG